jgi:hypothetical protein
MENKQLDRLNKRIQNVNKRVQNMEKILNGDEEYNSLSHAFRYTFNTPLGFAPLDPDKDHNIIKTFLVTDMLPVHKQMKKANQEAQELGLEPEKPYDLSEAKDLIVAYFIEKFNRQYKPVAFSEDTATFLDFYNTLQGNRPKKDNDEVRWEHCGTRKIADSIAYLRGKKFKATLKPTSRAAKRTPQEISDVVDSLLDSKLGTIINRKTVKDAFDLDRQEVLRDVMKAYYGITKIEDEVEDLKTTAKEQGVLTLNQFDSLHYLVDQLNSKRKAKPFREAGLELEYNSDIDRFYLDKVKSTYMPLMNLSNEQMLEMGIHPRKLARVFNESLYDKLRESKRVAEFEPVIDRARDYCEYTQRNIFSRLNAFKAQLLTNADKIARVNAKMTYMKSNIEPTKENTQRFCDYGLEKEERLDEMVDILKEFAEFYEPYKKLLPSSPVKNFERYLKDKIIERSGEYVRELKRDEWDPNKNPTRYNHNKRQMACN